MGSIENNENNLKENLEKMIKTINSKKSEKLVKKVENEEVTKTVRRVSKKNTEKINEENVEKKNNRLELGLYLIKDVFEEEIKEGTTKYIKNSIRSGNKIMYEGSLVIIGDVNAGAEIIAGGNIVVVGDLRGVAHAGATGNKKAIIAAENIESPQLRIANLLWENEENNSSEEIKIKKLAFIEGKEIKLINY